MSRLLVQKGQDQDPAQEEGGFMYGGGHGSYTEEGAGSESCTEGRPGPELCTGELGLGPCIIGTPCGQND